MDELTKVAINFAAPASKKPGRGQNSMVSLTSGAGFKSPVASNPLKANPAKPTNYSIVHSEAPPAAQGTASAVSKAVPPPPVRT